MDLRALDKEISAIQRSHRYDVVLLRDIFKNKKAIFW